MSCNFWTKTMLSLLRKLPREIINVNENINSLIRRTMFSRGETLSELEELRLLILHKKNMQYLIAIIKEIYRDIDSPNKHILLEKHYHDMTFREIAEERDTSLRSVFRWYDIQVDAFDKALARSEYDDEYLIAEFGGDSVIGREYRHQMAQSRRECSGVTTKVLYKFDMTDAESDSDIASRVPQGALSKCNN